MLTLAEHETLKEKIKSAQRESRAKERSLNELDEKSELLEQEWKKIDTFRTQACIAKEKSDT